MKVEIIERNENTLRFKIFEESHTLCNALKAELERNKNVTFVGYRKEHPLLDYSIFILKTKNESAEKTLANAIKNIANNLNELKKELK
ncbi:MAG: DNA-directed RNA polymerase subunit L [Candidatus Parvarchaeota archaeon]|nr:DNA-directed RNA polymerase subunit L [Candidatus Jingweiarchaeum tengchongense]MCW1297928.1 DNA-directed RNA polymerase subunit L [Candidatus Jingweiarchaeum tengchongense]MCW1300647.1 DNA-directed RNA polymerase subunit L [Candidatus Jingweiarchaeum tengchongense]MCW1304634.1 DNA-directed RNA polymerase subunit L [Candidatus Jingweiarchaeum tengchongense]MCW1305651.1 DNA-directed RNA polymerase subunit L [Candidatus Jingweiarchaeum tengchongense]